MIPEKRATAKRVRSKWHRVLKNIPRKRHLRGTWIHRKLGDRVFAHELWHLTRHGVAAGVAAGLFWAMMPIPFQMLPATITAFLCKFNIPAAMSSVWVTNPFTWPLILYWQYQLGSWILGWEKSAESLDLIDPLTNVPGSLLLGCLITGMALASIGYLGASLVWYFIPACSKKALHSKA
jgi:uncharacterized protein (DUF2062 family)